jgi:hypothetical protein
VGSSINADAAATAAGAAEDGGGSDAAAVPAAAASAAEAVAVAVAPGRAPGPLPYRAFSKQAAQNAALQAAGRLRGAAAATAAAMKITAAAAGGGAGGGLGAGAAGREGSASSGLGPREAAERDPNAIRVTAHKRMAGQLFSDVSLGQAVAAHAGVIWACGLSKDGSFLATAGQDCVLRVWQLTSSRCGGVAPGSRGCLQGVRVAWERRQPVGTCPRHVHHFTAAGIACLFQVNSLIGTHSIAMLPLFLLQRCGEPRQLGV